ncbi:MAG: winged helix-turn-helix domain-containing protein [Methermicoccaceae archaeon]
MKEVREYSKEECERWIKELEESKGWDITEDHRLMLAAMQNPTRRKVLTALMEAPMSIEQLSTTLNMPVSQLKFHVEMLKSARYVVVEEGVVDLTPRGVHYLKYR